MQFASSMQIQPILMNSGRCSTSPHHSCSAIGSGFILYNLTQLRLKKAILYLYVFIYLLVSIKSYNFFTFQYLIYFHFCKSTECNHTMLLTYCTYRHSHYDEVGKHVRIQANNMVRGVVFMNGAEKLMFNVNERPQLHVQISHLPTKITEKDFFFVFHYNFWENVMQHQTF